MKDGEDHTCFEIDSASRRAEVRFGSEIAQARASLASALRATQSGRKFQHLFQSVSALQSAALAVVAEGLGRGDHGRLVQGLVSWSRARLLFGCTSTVSENPVGALYAVEVARLLEPERRRRAAVKLLASHWLGVADADCADVLAFLPPSQYPVECRVAARADAAALRFAIDDCDAVEVGRIAERLARRYSRDAKWVGSLPVSWIPLPLILAREMCRAKGVRWREPSAPLWARWRKFRPHTSRVATPEIDAALGALGSLRAHIDELRNKLREQIVLDRVFPASR